MACEHTTLTGSDTKRFDVIIGKGRSRAKMCTACGELTEFLCDWPDPRTRSRTCDQPCCKQHHREVAPDTHYCIHHWKEMDSDMANQAYIRNCISVDRDQLPVGKPVFGVKPIVQVRFTEHFSCGHSREYVTSLEESKRYKKPRIFFCEQCKKENW